MSAPVEPVSPQVVGNAFVQQYYHILHQSPALVHRFYQDVSRLGRPEENGAMSITTTMKDINEKILSLNYDDFRAEIKSIDAQESFHGGVNVLVTGQMARKDNLVRNFTQTFFLAPQEKGYFVLNDMFRYIEGASLLTGDLVQIDEDTTLTPEQDPSPVLEIDQAVAVPVVVNVEKSVDDIVVKFEAVEEVPIAVVVEEVPLAVVVEQVPIAEVVEVVVPVETRELESESKIEGVAKKSYASIVMVMKQSGRALSSPAPASAPRRVVPKIQAQVKPVVSAAEIPISGSEVADDSNNQEGEADGYSIYIKGLPMNATPSILDEEFKKFGTIKSGGIQVRSNKGFCFGFVEFETADSVLKALEASPVVISGRHAVVEEKRSTNYRGGYNRGMRMQGGRGGPGFRNDGMRGGGRVGNYAVNSNNGGGRGGGGGYLRGGDYNNGGNRDFGNNNRFGNRGGFQNRGGDGGGYHHHNNNNNQRGGMGENGGRMNQRPNGGAAKEATAIPSVSASA